MSKVKKHFKDKKAPREFKTKASVLMNISCGKSNLTTKNMNSFFFLDDYQRFLNYKITNKPSVIVSNVKNVDEPPEEILIPRLSDDTSTKYDKHVLSEKSSTDSAPMSKKETVVSYIKHPNGRLVSSIYHDTTKRPSNLSSFVSSQKITDTSLYHYITSEHVEELNLENCSHLSTSIFKCIGSFCPYLKILNLFKCCQVSNLSIMELVQKPTGCVKNLICLNLSGIKGVSDVGLKCVFQNCVHLKVLSIHSNPSITGTCFQYLNYSSPQNNSGRECQIELLDVSYCYNMRNLGLKCVGEYCKHLKHLNVAGTNINDDSLINIIHNCYKLETLRLMLCDNLSAKSLSLITEFLSEIQILELTGIMNVTDRIVKDIAMYANNLILLSLNGCKKITDKSTQYIARYVSNLRVLELSNCKNIHCDGLIKLIHEIKHLRIICLNGSVISDSEVKILGKVSKRCKIIKNDRVKDKEVKKKVITLVRV